MLTFARCSECGGHFVAHSLDLHDQYRCGLCHVPSRAGKTKKAKDAEMAMVA